MIEKHIVLEDIDPVVLYGAGNTYLQIIKALYPKLRIVARDNVIRVLGDEELMASFEENIEKLRKHVLKYNSINEEDIIDIIKGGKAKEDTTKGVVVYNISGKPIKSRSENRELVVGRRRRFRYAGTVRDVHGSNDKRAYQVAVFWGLGTQNRVLRFFVRFSERQKIQSQLPRTRRDNGGGMFPDPVRLFQGEAYQKTGQLTERINFSKS